MTSVTVTRLAAARAQERSRLRRSQRLQLSRAPEYFTFPKSTMGKVVIVPLESVAGASAMTSAVASLAMALSTVVFVQCRVSSEMGAVPQH